MGVKHFIKALPDRGVKTSAYYLGEFLMQRFPMQGFGDPVYERDWDVLVIMDACRGDLFEETATEYDWIDADRYRRVDTNAGSSKEWMERTFTPEYADEVASTAYISGNPFTSQVLDGADVEFGLLDEVWKYAWDDDAGTIFPDPLTDRAITVAREGDFDRLIVHYMQPHIPFVNYPKLHQGYRPEHWGRAHTVVDDEMSVDVWNLIRTGELDHDEVWEAYRDNLEVVLESVDRLRQNIDADRMVLSADHGNSLGDRFIWGHKDIPVSGIREVPWAVVDAEDTGSSTPDLVDTDHAEDEISIEERLTALGYK